MAAAATSFRGSTRRMRRRREREEDEESRQQHHHMPGPRRLRGWQPPAQGLRAMEASEKRRPAKICGHPDIFDSRKLMFRRCVWIRRNTLWPAVWHEQTTELSLALPADCILLMLGRTCETIKPAQSAADRIYINRSSQRIPKSNREDRASLRRSSS